MSTVTALLEFPLQIDTILSSANKSDSLRRECLLMAAQILGRGSPSMLPKNWDFQICDTRIHRLFFNSWLVDQWSSSC
jgi:hypothetical protein